MKLSLASYEKICKNSAKIELTNRVSERNLCGNFSRVEKFHVAILAINSTASV